MKRPPQRIVTLAGQAGFGQVALEQRLPISLQEHMLQS
jgi:hypothetical protein